MNGTRRRAKAGVVSAISLVAALLAGCTPNDGQQPAPTATEPHVITVWTTETLPDRMAKSRAIVERFTAATGVTVDLVGRLEPQPLVPQEFSAWQQPRSGIQP